MDIQQVKTMIGQKVQIWPSAEGHFGGVLANVLEGAGPKGENLFLLDCGNLRFRLLDWRICSMTDQPFDQDVPVNEDGSVSIGNEETERPAVYAGKKKLSKRAKEQAAKPAKEQKQPAAEPAAREKKTCRCGCGGETYSLFVPGHDARVKSQLLKVARGQLAQSEVNQAVWDLVEENEKWHALYDNIVEKAAVEAEEAAKAAAEKEAENASEGNQS